MKHQNKKKLFRYIGYILLIIGFICTIIGFIDFFKAFNSRNMPKKFYLLFIGFPLIGIGSAFLNIGNLRERLKYKSDETIDIVKDNFNYVIDKDAKKCGNCGAINDKDALFCEKCGETLTIYCPFCGETLDSDDVYCNKCGKKIK